MMHRVGMNAAIDDIDFGVGSGAVLSVCADRPALRSVSTAPRADRLHVACLNNTTPRFLGDACRAARDRHGAPGRALRRKAGRKAIC